MTLDAIEAYFGIRFPDRHRQAFADAADPIHDAVDFLVPTTPYPGLDIVQVNDRLHGPPLAWPDFLVAFASNGCGDFFAYDCRTSSPPIIYIDPDLSVEENLDATDKLLYENFACWYETELQRYRAKLR